VYQWNQIEEAIERTEYERVLSELSSLEQKEGFVERRVAVTDRRRSYLEFLGKLSVGVGIGIFTAMFNFLIFCWLLHMDVNPRVSGTFDKTLKEPLATTDHEIVQICNSEIPKIANEGNSEEPEYTLKRVTQHIRESIDWVSHGLEAGINSVKKGVYLVADKLLENASWRPEVSEKVGKDIKETVTVLPEKRFMEVQEETQKEVSGFQQQNDSSRTVYIVQVGVFKNYSNAASLKERLIRRGYNVNITFTGSEGKKRIVKLCKVLIGEFNNWENAERVSAEIEKSEGLQAFVTPKEGQEEIY